MLINFVDATNDANHYTKPPPHAHVCCRISRVVQIYTLFYTFFAHARPEALAKSAVAALVSLVLVDDATALKAARVDVVLAHRATEESLTTVARRRAVVLAGRAVVTDRTVGARHGAASRRDAEVSAAGRRRVVERRRRHGRVKVGHANTAAGGTEIDIAHVRSICIQRQPQR